MSEVKNTQKSALFHHLKKKKLFSGIDTLLYYVYLVWASGEPTSPITSGLPNT